MKKPVEADYSQATQCVPTIREGEYRKAFREYVGDRGCLSLLLQGDALVVLKELPADSIDCAMTSPPYWGSANTKMAVWALKRTIGITCMIWRRYVAS